ncbi:hypothetical protein LL946_08385 [Knoellia locipacati]|uniref:hypothetical protein n=1 Tax=Knoellia locipacati TaxID=882824 RepID=UPI00384C59B7
MAGGTVVAAQPAQAEGCYIFNATSTGVSQRCTSYQILIFRTKTQCRDSWRPARLYWAYGPWVASGSTSRATCSAGDYRTNYDSVEISWR